MFGATELIVYLWFLPVTLCIIVPLVMLVVWSVGHLLTPLFTRKGVNEKQEERAIEGDVLSTARA